MKITENLKEILSGYTLRPLIKINILLIKWQLFHGNFLSDVFMYRIRLI